MTHLFYVFYFSDLFAYSFLLFLLINIFLFFFSSCDRFIASILLSFLFFSRMPLFLIYFLSSFLLLSTCPVLLPPHCTSFPLFALNHVHVFVNRFYQLQETVPVYVRSSLMHPYLQAAQLLVHL